jgi:hypothetical protein
LTPILTQPTKRRDRRGSTLSGTSTWAGTCGSGRGCKPEPGSILSTTIRPSNRHSSVWLGILEADVPKDDDLLRMQQAIAQKIAAVPGAESVSFGNSLPMDGNGWHDPVYAQDRRYAGGAMPPLREFVFGAPGFLKTLGIPLVAGRDFTWDEVLEKLPVGMVSENFAREFWGGPMNALGKRIRVSTKDDWREIVGVVSDVHDDGMSKDAPTIAYWRTLLTQFESDMFGVRRFVVFAIRTPRAGSESLMKDVRQLHSIETGGSGKSGGRIAGGIRNVRTWPARG